MEFAYTAGKEGEPVCDPIGQAEPGNVEDQLDDNELTAPRSFGGLCLPWWRLQGLC